MAKAPRDENFPSSYGPIIKAVPQEEDVHQVSIKHGKAKRKGHSLPFVGKRCFPHPTDLPGCHKVWKRTFGTSPSPMSEEKTIKRGKTAMTSPARATPYVGLSRAGTCQRG